MVTSPSGKGVVVIGGWNHNEIKNFNALLKLNKGFILLYFIFKFIKGIWRTLEAIEVNKQTFKCVCAL